MKQMNTARRQKNWDLRAACNFIGGGGGTGLIMAAGLAGLFGADIRIPLALGAVLVMAGLSMVWLEIGKPWRALNVFFHPQTSWMTREGIVAGPLVAAVAACVVFPLPGLPLAAMVLAAGFLFCQARILKASRGIPAWKQPDLLPFILATGLAEGAGLLVLLGDASSLALGWGLATGLVRVLAWRRYGAALVRDGAPQASLEAFETPLGRGFQGAQWGSLVLWAAALAGVPLAAPAAGVLAAGSGWGIKAVLITRAAFTRGAAIAHAPVRGRGISLPIEVSRRRA